MFVKRTFYNIFHFSFSYRTLGVLSLDTSEQRRCGIFKGCFCMRHV
ncbi:unnamed protein product [Acanthoscelides obtectus]|uniref:Uncharacterized protein n=1 Tax=Acanthoscelides obtectus TaxID=200917 RepID=A0A9P0LTI4_ACAOB|nr:unnamed protein product [Acanthoscelides obtectus]